MTLAPGGRTTRRRPRTTSCRTWAPTVRTSTRRAYPRAARVAVGGDVIITCPSLCNILCSFENQCGHNYTGWCAHDSTVPGQASPPTATETAWWPAATKFPRPSRSRSAAPASSAPRPARRRCGRGRRAARCRGCLSGRSTPGRNSRGVARARSHHRFVPPLPHFISDSLTHSVPLLFSETTMRPNPTRFAAWNRARGSTRGRTEVTWGQQTAAHLYDDDTQLENPQAILDQVATLRRFAPEVAAVRS